MSDIDREKALQLALDSIQGLEENPELTRKGAWAIKQIKAAADDPTLPIPSIGALARQWEEAMLVSREISVLIPVLDGSLKEAFPDLCFQFKDYRYSDAENLSGMPITLNGEDFMDVNIEACYDGMLGGQEVSEVVAELLDMILDVVSVLEMSPQKKNLFIVN